METHSNTILMGENIKLKDNHLKAGQPCSFASQSEPVPSDGLCRGQTESPAAGRLQTDSIDSIIVFSTYQPKRSLQILTFCLQGCRHHTPRAASQRKIKKREKACLLVCSNACSHTKPPGTHAIQQLHAHTQTHTHLSSLFAFPFSLLLPPLAIIPPSLFFLSSFFEPHIYTISVTATPQPPNTYSQIHTQFSLWAVCGCVREERERERESEECRGCMCVGRKEENEVCVSEQRTHVCVWETAGGGRWQRG